MLALRPPEETPWLSLQCAMQDLLCLLSMPWSGAKPLHKSWLQPKPKVVPVEAVLRHATSQRLRKRTKMTTNVSCRTFCARSVCHGHRRQRFLQTPGRSRSLAKCLPRQRPCCWRCPCLPYTRKRRRRTGTRKAPSAGRKRPRGTAQMTRPYQHHVRALRPAPCSNRKMACECVLTRQRFFMALAIAAGSILKAGRNSGPFNYRSVLWSCHLGTRCCMQQQQAPVVPRLVQQGTSTPSPSCLCTCTGGGQHRAGNGGVTT